MKVFCYSIILFYFLGYFGNGYPEVHPRLTPLFTGPKYMIYNDTEHIGVDCDTHEECEEFIEGSKCLDEKCKCPDSWLLSRDRTKCLKPAEEYGSPCEEDVQCSERLLTGGVCEENSCKCKEGYHYLKGICWKSQQLQQRCFRNEQCFSSYDYRGQECRDKTCVCRSGYYDRFNLSCRKIRNPGESCNVDSDCTEGSTCEKMKCTGKDFFSIPTNESVKDTEPEVPQNGSSCIKGRFFLDGKCVLELGMDCNTDDDCSHIPKASCMNKVCSCEPVLAVSNENRRKCLPVARGKVPDVTKSTCKENPQCSIFGENSYCLNRKCACKNGTYWDKENQLCWGIKGLGETCTSDKDCYPIETHAECSSLTKECTCQKGYYAKEWTCIPEALEVGAYCEKNEDCLFENALCDTTNQTCICRKNHFVENGQCIPGVGTPCETHKQCSHLNKAKCQEKICTCEDNHIEADHLRFCLPVAQYGDSCQESSQCRATMGPLSICNNGTCLCEPTAHYYQQECHRSRSIGQSCTKQQECFLNGDNSSTICLNGYCSCLYDYSLDAENCLKTNSGRSIGLPSFSIILMVCVTLRCFR